MRAVRSPSETTYATVYPSRQLPAVCLSRIGFEGQILISGGEFSTGGDSGSLIVSKGFLAADRRPVALLFAGSANNTIANPIDLVLDRFGVAVDGG